MRDTKELLRETRDRIAPPSDVLGSLERRRRRRERVKRGSAVMVAFVVALAAFGGWFAVQWDTATMPVGLPSGKDLGIFAGVRGWIAYGDPNGREPGVWAVDPASPGAAPLLLDPAGGSPLAWSRDGSKLLIQRAVGDPDKWGRQRHELLVLLADGSETLVADFPATMQVGGSFSPDGSQVIYAADGGIYSVPAVGGARRLLYAGEGIFSPVSSPDGSRLAFFEGRGDSENSLWVMNVDGTDKRRLLGVAESGRTPFSVQWSPDGTRLAFSRGGSDRTFGVIDADGSGLAFAPVAVSSVGWGAGPYWSPDGTRVAFAFGPGGSASIAIARPDGTVLQRFNVGPAGPWNPLEPTTTSTRAGET